VHDNSCATVPRWATRPRRICRKMPERL
jgi:hypothetical protein